MCSPSGVRILLSIAALRKWRLSTIDVKSAFLQTGRAERDVFVVPPRECADRKFYWLLLTATYGLVNANSKWQKQSDELLYSLNLQQVTAIPQLFYMTVDGSTVSIVAKIIDDMILAGVEEHANNFIKKFNSRFKLGKIIHGPGRLRFYGLNAIQHEEYSCSIDGDDKLNVLEPYLLSRVRRKQTESRLTMVERSAFMSLNSSLGWLGISASPFCSFCSSYLQQKLTDGLVSALISQTNALRSLKRLGTSIHFPRQSSSQHFTLSAVVFADAGRHVDYGQASIIAGPLLEMLKEDSTFHCLSWMSHNSKRPVPSTVAAEILAAAEAIEEGKILKSALSTVFAIKVRLIVAVDSKDLYTTLSTLRNATDRFIRADVNMVRFDFETGNIDEVVWIPGSVNPADPGTKLNSPLTTSLQLALCTGKNTDISVAKRISS